MEGYIGIVEDLLIGKRLPIFSRRAKRSLVSRSKFYFFDCGVFRSLRPSGPIDRPEDLNGQALEGFVYQHLQAWIDYSGMDAKLYYWRTRDGTEVDFVIYGKDYFWAFEVKNATVVRDRDIRHLKSFFNDYPESTLFFLYRGTETIRRDGVLCIPVETFMKRLSPVQKISVESFL